MLIMLAVGSIRKENNSCILIGTKAIECGTGVGGFTLLFHMLVVQGRWGAKSVSLISEIEC